MSEVVFRYIKCLSNHGIEMLYVDTGGNSFGVITALHNNNATFNKVLLHTYTVITFVYNKTFNVLNPSHRVTRVWQCDQSHQTFNVPNPSHTVTRATRPLMC